MIIREFRLPKAAVECVRISSKSKFAYALGIRAKLAIRLYTGKGKRIRNTEYNAVTYYIGTLEPIGWLMPSKVLPLFDITEHKAVVCLVLPC